MRRLLAWTLLLVHLFAYTSLHEVAKLGVFVEHFAQHRQEDPAMSLAAFVVLHYFSGNPMDDDYAQDMQLPFKSVDCANAPLLTLPTPLPELVLHALAPALRSSALPLYDHLTLPSGLLADIWQPPKRA